MHASPFVLMQHQHLTQQGFNPSMHLFVLQLQPIPDTPSSTPQLNTGI
jgi:hypothetical protein